MIRKIMMRKTKKMMRVEDNDEDDKEDHPQFHHLIHHIIYHHLHHFPHRGETQIVPI
jgi:hypothetical protein